MKQKKVCFYFCQKTGVLQGGAIFQRVAGLWISRKFVETIDTHMAFLFIKIRGRQLLEHGKTVWRS